MMPRRNRPIIYLAARYSRRAELQGYAAQLFELNLADVPARWLREDHDWDGLDTGDSLLRAQQLATDDLADLEAAHAVVVFTEEAGEYRRGGSLVELGFAIGQLKYVVIVGPAPNVFTTLPGIPRFLTWADALTHLVMWKDQMEALARRQLLLQ